MTLTFDEAEHRYTFAGKRVPSVTQIMASAGLTDYSRIPQDILRRAQLEGIAIHRMVELHVAGNLLFIPEWLEPFKAAWEKFVAESGFELWESEHRMYHERYGFAGTTDLIGVPRLFKDKSPAVVDLKRSFAGGQAIGVQLSAYAAMWNEEFKNERDLQLKRRYGLRLMANGEYRCLPFESPDDFGILLAALQIVRWKEKNL